MFASATQAEPAQDPGPQPTDPRRHGAALDDLIGMATGFARLLYDQAQAQAAQQAPAQPEQQHPPQATAAQPAPAPPPAASLQDLATTFDGSARTVRRCIMLAQSLDTPKQPARTPAPNRTAARKRILRAVEDTIQRKDFDDGYANCDSPEVLTAELRERMDAPDLDADITSRPTDDIIKDILRDLGLAALPGSRPWKRRPPADIAELNARAAAPTNLHQPGPGPGPQDSQPSPDPKPNQQEPAHPKPGHPAAAARPPIHPGNTLPKDPAEAVAFILHHHARTNVPWRPPPGD